MSGGGQPKNTTTTTKTELPQWLVNDYQGLIGQVNQVNAKPYQSYNGQLNANLSQGQNQALANAQTGAGGNAMQQQAIKNVISQSNALASAQNPYAGQNQYLNDLIGNTNNDITQYYLQTAGVQLPTQFAQGGAFGGSAMQQAQDASQKTLANSLASADTGLRYQDYTNQQNLWQQGFQNKLAASQNLLGASQAINGASALQAQYNGQLAGLGQVQQDYAQGNIDQAYNDWYQKNYGYDQQKINNYGQALNSISGNFSSQAATGANPAYKPRTTGGALAATAGGAAAGASFGPWGALAGGVIGLGSYYL